MRTYTNLAISELRRRAASGEALLEFAILDNDWDESKTCIESLLEDIKSGLLPLKIFEFSGESGSSAKEELSIQQLRNRLRMIDEIAIEQDRATQLELGYLKTRKDGELAEDTDG